MPARTGQDLVDRVVRIIPELRNPGSGETNRILAWLNDAQEEMVSDINSLDADALMISATTPTVADQRRYSVPADFDGIRYLEHVIDDTTDETVKLVPVHYIDDKEKVEAYGHDRWPYELTWSALNVAGEPRFYLLRGESFEVRPIPDGVYTLRMWYLPRVDDMTLEGNCDLPQAFFSALAHKAAIFARRFLHQKTDDLKEDYAEALARGMRRVEDRQDDGPKFIQYSLPPDEFI